MTTAQAGQYYLDSICPSNRLVDPMDAAFQTPPVNFTAARNDAAGYRDALATAIKKLSAPPLAWPAAVKPDVDSFVNALYGDVSSIDRVAQQTNLTNLINAWNTAPQDTAGPFAAAIRIKLGLSNDAMASCGG